MNQFEGVRELIAQVEEAIDSGKVPADQQAALRSTLTEKRAQLAQAESQYVTAMAEKTAIKARAWGAYDDAMVKAGEMKISADDYSARGKEVMADATKSLAQCLQQVAQKNVREIAEG
jgi:hypothetical protein